MLKPPAPPASAGLTIEAASLRDVDVYLGIERAAFSSDRIARAEFEQLVRSGTAAILIARYDRSAVGALVLKRIETDHDVEAYLYSLAVVPAFRRLGIGRVLISRVIVLASDWGASRISLEVRPENHGAISLYENAGFFSIGKRLSWYEDGSSCVCMTRNLCN